ncbi:hypothetical protein BJI69_08900 [Luteibacter rhizovicinus DSM 16549]|uniref:Uncharacterized protein n=1 Tax=Luteibacter rhizovicinus DSM 16549 TaxID=1440763 RepID=A0A0G9HA42_9GAMM|nr:hypothetical protein [Luteibacter rhizovicinus]APG04001.1 hypothetical protein BJI69_08900 [Luteibacter rhizovicinus DSM 16549]KLD66488.1 hypothetical protein Y883_13680 [Luteibacter rhizovicinus DSM 16549]KLD73279.1 hypothetical protein Y886_38890 [Xanthomonas hyacinthi DSM 19077]
MEDKGTPDDFARAMADRLKKPEYATGTYEPPKRKGGKSAVMAKIESRADALAIVRETSILFLCLAGLQAFLAMFIGRALIVDAVIYVVLAGLLWRFNSRAAASILVLFAALVAAVTVAHLMGVKMPGGTNVFLAGIALWSAIRAVEATYKLRGQFASADAAAST